MESNKTHTIYKCIMLVILTGLITFMITSIGMYNYFTKTNTGKLSIVQDFDLSDETKELQLKLEMVKEELEEKYIGQFDNKKMIQYAIKGYVEGLEDNYTEYLIQDEYEELLVNVTGDYVGIGVYMTQNTDGDTVIVSTIENSPAVEADLKADDIITKVNGEECKGLNLETISSKIKGEEGTIVELEIVRGNETLTKKIMRKSVEIQTSSSKVLDDNIGYIKLESFDEGCSEKIKEYIKEFEQRGVKSLIFDLRSNTGGVVDEAIAVSEIFVPEGNIVMRSYNKEEKEKVVKSTNANPTNMKLVVLVDEYSASATEIVTAALKDNKVATIVGTKTYGKGVMQEVLPMFNGALKMTVEEFKTPNGDKINEQGIEPDVEVKYDGKAEEDNQLQKAIELLK